MMMANGGVGGHGLGLVALEELVGPSAEAGELPGELPADVRLIQLLDPQVHPFDRLARGGGVDLTDCLLYLFPKIRHVQLLIALESLRDRFPARCYDTGCPPQGSTYFTLPRAVFVPATGGRKADFMTQTPSPVIQDTHPVVYFVSDVHLGGSPEPDESTKRERLETLFRRVSAEKGSLYILGDLFDFWFEYATVMPKTGFGILARLDAMVGDGTPVRYLGGNHDFWIQDFLKRETRVEVVPDGVLLEAQGRRARLLHGDGQGPGDTGYKMLKKVLRNPWTIRAFRWLHPDLGIRLAMHTSGVSRDHTADHRVDVEGLFRHVAVPSLEGPADAVLMGHHHVPVHWQRDPGEMLILGDWFRNYTCVRLHQGKFELLTWPLGETA